jgi:hypothetical protein
MRWGKVKPKNGDRKLETRFAWLPVLVDSGNVTVWLERYASILEYVVEEHGCADCTNTLSPCDGREFDKYWKETSRESL